jgi:hypothetical protein
VGGCVESLIANYGGKAAWIVPTYRNSRVIWDWMQARTRQLRRYGMVRANKSERVFEFTYSGGLLAVYTADNEDAIRGEAFDIVILDEGARMKSSVWFDVVLPTLADHGGDAFILTTPRGKDWLWHEWLRGQDPNEPDYMSWMAPSSDNPNPFIQDLAHKMRGRVPERTYRQEWLGQFIDDGGEVFRGVRERATIASSPPVKDGHLYCFGVDWAKHNDWTVICVGDIYERSLVHIERFNQIDYRLQVKRLNALAQKYKPAEIIAERNSMGEPLIEQLQSEYNLPVTPFNTTNKSKTAVIESLALAFENANISILKHDALIGELESFTVARLPSGLFRYEAPSGFHDDCVIAAALCWQGIDRGQIASIPGLY